MTTKIKILFWGFHLVTILLISVNSTVSSYSEFYYSKTADKIPYFKKINEVVNSDLIRVYSQFTGTETGYGFFAPNVSSEFIVRYKWTDKEGEHVCLNPKINSSAGIIKYASGLSLYLDELEKDKITADYRKAITKCILNHFVTNNKISGKVKVEILLYDFPTIEEFKRTTTKPIMICIYELHSQK